MDDCKEYIAEVYLSAEISTLIDKCEPSSLRDDLRQEMALSLLQQPCQKILDLKNRNKLLHFALKTIWNMAASSNSGFYTKYRKKDITKATAYIYSLIAGKDYTDCVNVADKKIQSKMNSGITEHHEALLFNKYIELRSCDKVAAYYNIPKHHVVFVVAKVKNELKQLIKNQ